MEVDGYLKLRYVLLLGVFLCAQLPSSCLCLYVPELGTCGFDNSSLFFHRAHRLPPHWGPEAMACLHETRTPSPSFGGFVSTLSEASMRKLDPDTSDCTPEKDLTPTQCVLRDVVPLGGQGGGGPSPSPGGEPPPEPFANSVLQLHEQDAGGPGGATGSPESRASRVRADEVRLQCQSGSGFLEGLFGCLRPVWTMIGKAYSTEHKQQQEGRLCA